MAKAAKTGNRPLTLTPRQEERALRISADRAMRLAVAFGVKVPGKTMPPVKESAKRSAR